MLYQIPLEAIPSQTFGIMLGEQECRITLETRGDELYFGLNLNNVNIYSGVICRDRINLTPYEYRGFVGSLYFADIQGQDDPIYNGLNDRFLLIYDDGAE